MNWFIKYAQSFQDGVDDFFSRVNKRKQESELRPGQDPTAYSQIGHYSEDHPQYYDCEEYLWIWADGSLDYIEGDANINHERQWGEEAVHNFYSGRYDDCKNIISIGIPMRLENREVPGRLLDVLMKEFSPDARVYTFQSAKEPGNPRSGIQRVASCTNSCKISR